MYMGIQIEDYFARYFKVDENHELDYESISKNINKDNLRIFVDMLISKSPNLRASKHLTRVIGAEEYKEANKSKDFDSMIVWMRDMSKFPDEVNEKNKMLDLFNGKPYMILENGVYSPWIDPGFSIFKNSGESYTFVLQISPNHFLFWGDEKYIDNIVEISEDKTKENSISIWAHIFDEMTNNPLLGNIYFSKDMEKHYEKNMQIVAKKWEEQEANKPITSIALMSNKSVSINITFEEGTRSFVCFYNDVDDWALKVLHTNKELSVLLKTLNVDILKKLKLRDLEKRVIFVFYGSTISLTLEERDEILKKHRMEMK